MITITASAGHSGLLLGCLLWVPRVKVPREHLAQGRSGPLEALTTGHGGTPCRQHHPAPTQVKGGKGFCLPTLNHRRNSEGQVCQSSGTQWDSL